MKAIVFANELKLARKRLGLTQEQACVLIGISEVAVLSRWENGKEMPSDKVMDRIVEAYEDDFLGYCYLKLCTRVGQRVLPDVVKRDLGSSLLVLQKEHMDINRVKDTMIEIACDGQIDEHEQDSWEKSMKEVDELAVACMGLRFIQNKKPLQCGNIEKAYS